MSSEFLRIVYLAGFMGAGKSTVGPILANTIGWDFLDLDKVIEGKAGKKVKEIFSQSGEEYFRQLETDTLEELSKKKNHIIALGGGAIASQRNLKIIKREGSYTVYLKASPEQIYERLKHKRDRPVLLKNGGDTLTKAEFIERINKVFNERRSYYEKSDIVFDTDNVSIGKTVDVLANIITKRNKIQERN